MTPKPCPFCGAAPKLIGPLNYLESLCPNFNCPMSVTPIPLSTWNSRPAEDAIISRIISEIERLSMHYKTDALEQLKERILKP